MRHPRAAAPKIRTNNYHGGPNSLVGVIYHDNPNGRATPINVRLTISLVHVRFGIMRMTTAF